MLDTRTTYMGLQLRSPVVVGACPLMLSSEKVRQVTLAGAGAIVLPSLFEEQISEKPSSRFKSSLEMDAEFEPTCAMANQYNGGIADYMATISRLKRQTGIPIIASLNGCTLGTWLKLATDLETAGASGIEVCFEPTEMRIDRSAASSERLMLDMLESVRSDVLVPIAVKLSPFHTNLSNFAIQLAKHGASSVVCFASEPIWDVSIDRVAATPKWELHPAGCINQTIAGVTRVAISGTALSVAASGGVSSTEDCIKVLLAGANVAMVTSEIYRSGPDAIAHLVDGLTTYLTRNQFRSMDELFLARPAAKLSRKAMVECLTRREA